MNPYLPPPIEPKSPKLPRWLGAVPGIVIATVFGVRSFVQMGHVTTAIGGSSSSTSISLSCVDTYGINLANSEYYVPEGQQFTRRQTPELSTVLNGMVRNNCADKLKSVAIPITVHDDAGKRGDGVVTIYDLNPGEAKPFSKAWMGRVTSYEIGTIR